jgi:CHASE2 domain-containing sensor protein
LSTEPVKDPLALGLGSLASGVGFGGACLTLAQIVAAILRGDLESNVYRQTVPDPLLAGLIAAVGVGGACGWYRSAALDNIWQRGVIAVLAAVGAIIIGFLAAPLDRFFGLLGMIVWLLLNIAFGILATRWAMRGKGEEGSGTGTA